MLFSVKGTSDRNNCTSAIVLQVITMKNPCQIHYTEEKGVSFYGVDGNLFM